MPPTMATTTTATIRRRTGPTPAGAPVPSPSTLALEKVIQDHIPTVSAHLRRLLSLLTPPPPPKHSLRAFERDLRALCHLAQDGVKRMDAELRTIEAGWDVVDRARWDICRRDYKGVMRLVQQVWEAGQGRMEELRDVGLSCAGGSGGVGRGGEGRHTAVRKASGAV